MSTLKWSAVVLMICLAMFPAAINARSYARRQSPTTQPQFTTIAVEGDPAPPDIGGTYSRIESSSIDSAGEIVFSADLSDSTVSSAIMLDTDGAIQTIVRSGSATPAGGTFSAFHEVDIADGKFVLFRAEIQGISSSEGVFLWTPSDIKAVELAGNQTNGRYPGRIYKSFNQLTVNSVPDLNGNFFPVYAFVAELQDDGEAVVWSDYGPPEFGPPPTTALVSGLKIGLKMNEVMDSFSLPRLPGLSLTVLVTVHKLNGNGNQYHRPVLLAEAGAGLTEWDASLREGLNTTIGKLSRIDAPMSVSIQAHNYFLGEFPTNRGHSKAILLDDIFSLIPLSSLLHTGEAAPGLANQKIKDIGPPVSNPVDYLGAKSPLPQAVVSPVRLSGGQNALWVAVLTLSSDERSYSIGAKLALIGGATGNPAQPSLSSFNPVKLTDAGALLVNGTVGDAGGTRNGVFTLTGLF